MDFESIIGFIFFIVITSLFNKDKRRGRNSKQHPSQKSTINDTVNKPKTGTFSKSTTTPTTRSAGTNRLEDFLKEMQKDINEVFGEFQSTGHKPTARKAVVETATEAPVVVQSDTSSWDYDSYFGRLEEPNIEEMEPVATTETIVSETGIDNEEIHLTRRSLSFNRSSMVQAIIMSEILEKPKSLRR